MSQTIGKLQRVIQELRIIQADMPAQTMLALTFIYQRNKAGLDATVQDVGRFLGTSGASASRNVSMLSKISYNRNAGAGLVYAVENPDRKIEKFIRMTKEGEELMSRIEEYLK